MEQNIHTIPSAGLDRVIVTHIKDQINNNEVEAVVVDGPDGKIPIAAATLSLGGIYIPNTIEHKEEVVNDTVEAVVVSVGPSSSYNKPTWLAAGEKVRVFPNVYETKITLGDTEYISYNERDIICKI